MKIAVEGCCHGELDKIYGRLQELEQTSNDKIDLVLICGDFQAIRNPADLRTMAVPPKYAKLGNFHEYYSGQKKAPYLTLFVGGNHEASNHLWELYHGGWVCENIYYLGAANVVNYKGLRIGGISGIYKHFDYYKGHYERYPYNRSDERSIYHVRDYDVQKLLKIQKPIDIMISHDWPAGIEHCGDLGRLLKIKPFFREDARKNVFQINRRRLGNPAHTRLLKKLKPSRWFSAHLHVRYTANVDNTSAAGVNLVKAKDDQASDVTQFLALDKCLPNRPFLEIIDIPDSSLSANATEGFSYDLEWLAITRAMQPYLSTRPQATPLPSDDDLQSAIDQELMYLDMLMDSDELDLTIPSNFQASVGTKDRYYTPAPNPQTVEYCRVLGIDDVIAKAYPEPSSLQAQPPANRVTNDGPSAPPSTSTAEVSAAAETVPTEAAAESASTEVAATTGETTNQDISSGQAGIGSASDQGGNQAQSNDEGAPPQADQGSNSPKRQRID